MKIVPAQIKYYTERISPDLHYLETNRQRKKTEQDKKNEFFRYKQILCQIAELKTNQGLKKGKKSDNTGGAPGGAEGDILKEYENFLSKIGYSLDDHLNSTDVAAKAAGMTREQARMLNRVVGEMYIEGLSEKWKKLGLAEKSINEIVTNWYDLKKNYEEDKLALESADTEFQKIVAEVEKKLKLNKKEKAVKEKPKPKPRCYLAFPITNNPDCVKESRGYIAELSEKYSVVNPLSLYKAGTDEEDWILAMETLLPELAKCTHFAVRGDLAMVKKSKGVRIEIAVAKILGKKEV